MLLDPFGWTVESSPDGRRRAFHADDAGAFEHHTFVGTEPLDLFLDQLLDVLRNIRFELTELALQLPAAVRLDEDLFVDQVVHQVDHEQRIAIRAAVDRSSKPSRELESRKLQSQILDDRVLGQIFERKFMTETVRL